MVRLCLIYKTIDPNSQFSKAPTRKPTSIFVLTPVYTAAYNVKFIHNVL